MLLVSTMVRGWMLAEALPPRGCELQTMETKAEVLLLLSTTRTGCSLAQAGLVPSAHRAFLMSAMSASLFSVMDLRSVR